MVGATPFTIAWWLLAGTGRRSAIAGGIVLTFLLITYSHYLGPIGLPSDPARLLAENSPPADVHWLSYREEFMVMLPLTAIVASIGYWLASNWLGGERGLPISRGAVMSGIVAATGLVILGVATAGNLGPEANRVTVASIGPASLGDEPVDATSSLPAELRMTVANRNTHRTPLPPHDRIALTVTIAVNGQTYAVRADQAMIADPEGRFTTWYGVGFGEWHEGRSGIGLLQTPPMKSDVVAFEIANLSSDRQPAAIRVPFQVSATSGDERRLDLRIGDAAASPDALPLHLSWADFEADSSMRSKYARYTFGGGILLVFLVFVFLATRRQQAAHFARRAS